MAGKKRPKAAQEPATQRQDQASATVAVLGQRATGIVVAIVAVATAALARAWLGIVAHRAEGGLAAALQPLRAGACGLGGLERPGVVEAVEASQLNGLRLPAGVRCPLVIRGLAESENWQGLARWGDLKELERHTPSTITFDASQDGEFAYWDNHSLLAGIVRQVGVLRQGYSKVTAPRRAFFDALANGPSSALGAVRFGGKVSMFSRDIANGLGSRASGLAPEGASASAPALWLSTGGSFSTAHYDSFHNVFVMLGGEKTMLLSPAADAPLFHVYPGTHPLARQARRHFGRLDATDKTNELPATTRVLSVTVKGGEALFIPAGWLHHVTARTTAISLSLTALPREHDEFNAWMLQGGASVLPFLASGGQWTTARLAAALRVFTPALLRAVDFGTARPPAVRDPLRELVDVSYGPETRRELGLPAALPHFAPCGKASAPDREAAQTAAAEVAHRFNGFQEELRGLYVMPYLETALSRVAGPERDPARIMLITMSFIEACLKS